MCFKWMNLGESVLSLLGDWSRRMKCSLAFASVILRLSFCVSRDCLIHFHLDQLGASISVLPIHRYLQLFFKLLK